MVVANGFSPISTSLIVLMFIIQYLAFVKYFTNAFSFFNNYYYIVEIAMAKMFLQFEDTDLTKIPLCISNILLHFTNISTCFGVTLYHFVKITPSAEFMFYLGCLICVEVGTLFSIQIEYFIIKRLVFEALTEFIKTRRTRD